MTYIYFISQMDTAKTKVGITNNLPRRLRQIQTGNDKPLSLIGYIEYDTRTEARIEERRIHKLWQTKRLAGEWFDLGETDLDELARIYDIRSIEN
ncbi:MAG: GIY-YIG nuclease family protein [Opitutae bacterium]